VHFWHQGPQSTHWTTAAAAQRSISPRTAGVARWVHMEHIKSGCEPIGAMVSGVQQLGEVSRGLRVCSRITNRWDLISRLHTYRQTQ
jgi:hypothetical protein